MATRTDRFTLHELLLTEAVKDLEAGTPLQDSAAMADAARATTDRAARHVRRALQLAAATGLDDELSRLRRRAVALGIAVAAVGVACAALLALSMLGEGRRINALAAMALLIVPNAIGIVLWALLLTGGRGGAGWLAGGASWLAQKRWAQGGVQRVLPAALRLLDAQRLTPWVLGGLNHLLWALAYGLAALLLVAVLAFSAYRLGWETTILSPQTLQETARTLAWLPAALGLPAQVPANAEAAGASQALGWWLISGTLVYGALPRLLLLVLCVAVTLSRSRDLPLDLQDPYHRRLINRFEALAPTLVIDSERAAPAHHHDAAAAAAAAAGPLAVIGFELPPELSAPAPLLAQAAWTQRVDGGSDERQALLQRLATAPPARLIVVCHAPSTPDRGTLRFLGGLRADAVALLLAPPAAAGGGAARWRDWLADAGRSDLPVFTDAESALRWRGAAHG